MLPQINGLIYNSNPILIFWCYNNLMENGIKIKTVYGLLGIFVLTKPMYLIPYGDYHINTKELSEATGLSSHKIIQTYPVVWQR